MPVEYSETQKKALVDAAVIAGFEKDKVHIRLESVQPSDLQMPVTDFSGTIACFRLWWKHFRLHSVWSNE